MFVDHIQLNIFSNDISPFCFNFFYCSTVVYLYHSQTIDLKEFVILRNLLILLHLTTQVYYLFTIFIGL